MNEEIPKVLTPEQQLSQEREDRYAQWMKDHPEVVIAPENRRECDPEIAELEKLIDLFESEYSLEELHLIIDLTVEEAPQHPVREPASLALIPINAKLNSIKEETNISRKKHEELRARYTRLSKAVGIINNNKVDHDCP
ncbi:MAG: hypothetical protein V1804_03045 [Patescibacteria group bacterium]